MPTSTLPAASTEAGFDTDISDVNNGQTNTAYTASLQNPITITASQTLTAPSGSSLEIDGPGTLTFNSGQALFVTSGTLTLDAAVSGDSYTQASPAATIVLEGGALVNGSSVNSGSSQVLSGSVVGESTTDTVDNFGQIVVTAAGTTAVLMNGASGEAVTNESTGTIDGGLAGVVFSGAGTLTNSGTVGGTAAGYGAYFEAAGTLVNGPNAASSALIKGTTDGVFVDASGAITNDAAILGTGTSSAGVAMASGTVNNGLNQAASASIEGGEYGVLVSGGSATVTNLGTIEATDTSGQASPIAGISLTQGGTVYNGLTSSFAVNANAVTSGANYGVLVQGAAGAVYNSGTISGKIAVSFSAAGTIRDNGAITSTDGAGGTAIQFGTGNSTLALGSGFDVTGKVEGASGSGNTATLELTDGINANSTSETFSGLSGGSGSLANGSANSFAFDNITTIAIDSGSTGATGTFSGNNTITNLQLGAGTTAQAIVSNAGTLAITGTATGTGQITLGTGANLVIASSAGFGTNQGSTANYTGDVIAQFAVGDSIDLQDVAFSTGLTQSFSNNTLQVSDGTHTADLAFASASGFTGTANFIFATDGGSGTLVTVACYCPGTAIATPEGEVGVEDLAIGDLVVTADGGAKPIRWIGRRSYAGRFLDANPKMQPIRFRAGSLGNGLPRRDLLVSPEHAMLLDGLLVPARCLVNGGSIVRERGMTAIDYIHIELADHDVILAEGAASETFIDDDSRCMFENASEYAALYPDAAPTAGFCARRVEDGYELEAIRQRLATPDWFAEAA